MQTEYTANGIKYTWDLAGSQGASFLLFPERKHTKDDVQKAKAWLKDNHDVVSLKVANEDELDYEYRARIFEEPQTKPLKWYEMNVDNPTLIRMERKLGTTPLQYVEKWVLPYISITRENNIKKFGKERLMP